MILALDPGTTTGWAVDDASGAVGFALRTDAQLTPAQRHGRLARRFRDWLAGELDRHQVGVLVLERQQGGRGGGTVTLGLRMTALELAARRNLAVEEVWPSQWQAWAKRELSWAKTKDGDAEDAAALLAFFRANVLLFVENPGGEG